MRSEFAATLLHDSPSGKRPFELAVRPLEGHDADALAALAFELQVAVEAILASAVAAVRLRWSFPSLPAAALTPWGALGAAS